MLANFLLLALCALGFASAAEVRTCSSVSVPACAVRVDRDLLFLVDASESLDPVRFQNEMLNYVQSLYCAFNQQDNNRAGMITFASEIVTRIPLDSYTVTQWFQKVDEVRAQNLCCSCCTPTATAFQLAREVFEAIPLGNAFRIVFVITDGAPWQNEDGPFAWPSIPSATYTWGTVPTQAGLIKAMAGDDTSRYRVMMVGVPNKFGDPPREDYFRGIPDPSKRPSGKAPTWQCQTRGGKKTCYQMSSPPKPIISTPVDKNIFSSQTYEVQDLINLTVGSLCEILPTDSPTRQPTSPAPTTITKAPTLQPTKEPTKGPTNAPTDSPVRPELDGLDLYLLLDRSRSMRWVPELCRNAPGGNPADGDAIACWKLFLTFVRQIVTKTVNIPYRNTVLGWKGDSADPKRGVRVWLYAFACANEQTTPIVVHLGERIETLDQFNAAMDIAAQEIPFGGTCPGAAIERAVAMVQGNELMTRLFKAAILISDGVFYDGQRPIQGAKGFAHFGVLTYSMGIAIPSEGQNWGLTPEEIKRQKLQLTGFVQGNEARLFNFGLEGLNLLDAIAQELADQLPHDAIANLPNVAKQPFWCGWTSIARCTDTSDNNTPTGLYCKWDYDRMKCFNKDACKHLTRAQCSKDKYCKWQKGQKCIAKPNVVG